MSSSVDFAAVPNLQDQDCVRRFNLVDDSVVPRREAVEHPSGCTGEACQTRSAGQSVSLQLPYGFVGELFSKV